MTLAALLFALAMAVFLAALIQFGRGVATAWNDPGFAPHRAKLIWNYMGAIKHAPPEAQLHFRRFFIALFAFILLCAAGVLLGLTQTTTSR